MSLPCRCRLVAVINSTLTGLLQGTYKPPVGQEQGNVREVMGKLHRTETGDFGFYELEDFGDQVAVSDGVVEADGKREH